MSPIHSQPKEWAISLIICGILLVLMMTLFPYDFFIQEMMVQMTWKEFGQLLTESSNRRDIILNLLLFIPFGWGLAVYLDSLKIRFFRSVSLIFVFSLGLSLTVEILQFFLPARTSTPIDLLTNTLSGMAGGLLFYSIGKFILIKTQLFFTKLKSLLFIPSITLFFMGSFIVACWFSVPLQNTDYLWGLQNWNMSFPLNLKNELTGDRPWNGEINQVCFTDKNPSSSELKKILTSELPCNSLSTSNGFLYSIEQPQLSQFLLPELNQAFRQTNELTLILQLATSDSNQIGPARIVSISQDFFQRNLTLGQWRSHLSIRLRTPVTQQNGTLPEFIIPNVFSDLNKKTILLNYNSDEIQVFINDKRHSLKLTPEMAFFWQFSPVTKGAIHLNRWNLVFYKLCYYGLIFCPLGYSLSLILQQIKGKSTFYLYFGILGILIPVVSLEIFMSNAGNRSISWENLLLSFSLLILTMMIASVSRTHRVFTQKNC